MCQTGQAPTYFIPFGDWKTGALIPARIGHSVSRWTGLARYYHVVVDDAHAARAAWGYSEAEGTYAPLRNSVSVFADLMDACFIADEQVLRLGSGYSAGWVTSNLTGLTQRPPSTECW